jgi:integrase
MAHVERRKRNGKLRYRARYLDPSGRERSKTFDTKRKADQFLARVEVDKSVGSWVDPTRGRVTVDEWATRWLATVVHLKPKTRAGYESILEAHVRPKLGTVPIARVDTVAVREFVSNLTGQGLGAGTVRNSYNVLRSICATAVEAGAIKVSPCRGVKLPRPDRDEMVFLDAPQVDRLDRVLGEPAGTLVVFAAFTGLRAGEIGALRVGRVDLLRGTVDVVESYAEVHGALVLGATKTYERRTVRMPRFLCDRLGEHLAREGLTKLSDLVFTDSARGPLRHSNFYRRTFKPAVIAAGLPEGLRFHDLRHTCAALLIAQGAHPKAMMERFGHSSVTVTLDRYGHLFPSLDETLVDGLERTYREAISKSSRPNDGPEVVELVSAKRGNTG